MNEKQNAIKSSSKVISVLMQIGYIAMIVAACICVTSLIFVAVTGGKTSLILSGGIKIVAVGSSITTVKGVVALCVAAMIMIAFLFSIFYIAYRMFNEIHTTCNPFNEKYVKSIKTIGILVVVMTIVGSYVDHIASELAGVETFGFSTDSTSIVFGVIIYCLAFIFDYGCTLQKQSEETL